MVWYNGTRCKDRRQYNPEQVLIGTLFGDGYINRSGKNKTSVSFELVHSIKQKEYLLWKNEFLRKILVTKITECSEYHKVRKKTYNKVRLISRVNPLVSDLDKLFYKNGRKYINKKILYTLEPLGLAVWYCDDGSYDYQGKIIIFCTHCFSLDEQNLIKGYFFEKWDINAKIKQKNGLYYLYINRENSIKFLNIIKDNVPESMFYKLGEIHPLNKARLEETRLKINSQKLQWRLNNKEKYLQQRKEYRNRPHVRLRLKEIRDRNREKNRAYSKLYYKKNVDRIKEYRKNNEIRFRESRLKYYNENRNIILNRRRDYYQKNRDILLKKQKNYSEKNKDKRAAYHKSYYNANRERILENARIYSKIYYRRKRIK